MNRMKVLLFASIASQWTVNYIDNFLLKNNCEIWMLNRYNLEEERKNIDLLEKKGVHFIDGSWLPFSKSRWLRKLCFFHHLNLIIKSGHYDIINLHSVNFPYIIYAVKSKKRKKEKLILSYWGSDILCASDRKTKYLGKYARHADYITFDNGDLEKEFKKKNSWWHEVKLETVLLGLPVLDIIHEKKKAVSEEELRKKWEIPKDQEVVAIGYNAGPQQQHLEVLQHIDKLDRKVKDKLFLLLQMTYQGTDEYKEKVVQKAKEIGCEYMVLQSFLTDEEVAEIRIMTDIYINAQTTDAFSGSVCENLYAGAQLINASWLRYQEFKDYDFQYMEFKDMDEIPLLLEKAIAEKPDLSGNKELVWKLRSWEACFPKWKRVYNEVVK